MKSLLIKDQLIICVTDALTLTNRHFEASPRFSSNGQLTHIDCLPKRPDQSKSFKLVVAYDEFGNINSINDTISVNVRYEEINYEYIHAELMKLFRSCVPSQSS